MSFDQSLHLTLVTPSKKFTHTHRFTVSVDCCFGWQVIVLHGQTLKWEWLAGFEAVLINLCSDWTWMLNI